jgi:hypothetical protein
MSLLGKLFNRKKQENNQEKFPFLEGDNDAVEEQLTETTEGERRMTEPSDDASEEDDIEYEVVEREILPAKIICPDCGGITLEGLDFCDKCGGELY